MALLGWELKKIWRPGLLLAIALMGVVFYHIRTGFYLEHFKGNGSEAPFYLSQDWLERYGTTIEPSERAGLDSQLEELEDEFARQVTEILGAVEAGITDYESFIAWNETRTTEADRDLYWSIYYNTELDMVKSLFQFVTCYDTLASGGSSLDWGGEIAPYSPAHEASVRRIEDMEAEGVYGFLPNSVMDSTDEFFYFFSIWCAFSAVLLLSPTLVRDRLRRVRAMQWAARWGRQILTAQMGAALLSGMLLTLLNCAAYLGPFRATGALQFWNCSLVSVWSINYPWFDWTYGQYLLVLLGLTVLITLAACGFTVVLSQFSSNYVSMLLKAIPLLFVLCWGLVPWVVMGAGRFSSASVWLTGLPGAEFVCGGLAALLALVLCILTIRRQRKAEL